MKVLLLLLPLYLMILSCLPCRDGDESADMNITISQADNTGHHHQSESCTPFCTCSCCGIISIANGYLQKQIIAQTSVQPAKPFTHTISFLSNQHLQSIWQPPRYS